MKVITIGRGEDNQIVLEDNQDMISRQHATLRIYETGKMEIVSTGSNGTFVNGFRIKPNIPYKVTRKDVISFAHVRQLDWALVPDPFRLVRYSIVGTVVAVLVAIVVYLCWPKEKPTPPVGPIPPVKSEINVDSVDNKPSEPKKETSKEESKTPEVEVESKKENILPAKRFPAVKKEKEKKEKEKPAETEEANPQNQVF